jgi:hypothetical protein
MMSVNIRLILKEGAIDGSLELLSIVVSPIRERAN